MNISLNWLSDYVNFIEKDPQRIAEALTCSVSEIDEVEVQGALLDHCVVGKVLTIEDHPNADKLKLCDIKTDKGTKRIVCGGANLREGMLVAFAHVGARVKWHGEEMMTLEKVKIRGETSEGMACGADELGLENVFPESVEATIIDMGDDIYPVGQDLREALGLDDVVFHIDNHSIAHRADLFSHYGIARECVAIGLGTWKKRLEFPEFSFSADKLPFKFHVDAKEGMPRYCACLIEIDDLGETPEWMKSRLEATGWRSLNLPIDITNFVMMEVGVPLHSFDADDFQGDIHMRRTKKGEKMTTLDGVERDLSEGTLILEDDAGIFDLLGIMGGLRSSTKDSTRRIYLHSASLDPVSIRKTIMATGHRTDAATVYEKGVPSIITEQGFYRALQLFLELVPGARIASEFETYGENGSPKPIMLSVARVQSLLGNQLSAAEIMNALTGLDFDISRSVGSKTDAEGSDLSVTPPLHRLGDVHEAADLIEEVARVIGFDEFESALPDASIGIPGREMRVHAMRDFLKEAGFSELKQISFVGEDLLKKCQMDTKRSDEIENPLGEDMKFMRPSLLPRMLEAAELNLLEMENDLRFFETGHIFSQEKEASSFTLLFVDKHDCGLGAEPVLVLKSIISEMLSHLGHTVSFSVDKRACPHKHPARTMNIKINDASIGSLSELHPKVVKVFGLPNRAAVCEIDVDALLALEASEIVYTGFSAYPSITYDTTVPVADDTSVGLLLEGVRGSHEFLNDIHLSKIYQKDGVRNLTFRCTYGSDERTLTEEEVKPVHENIEAKLRS